MISRSLVLAALLAASSAVAYAQGLPAPIETQELRSLDAWSVSALSRAQGALAPDLWSPSDPAVLAAAFERLPASQSPALLSLARRVLFSGGDAPRGDATAAARGRFEALGRLGAADELATMAAGAGAALSDPAIAQFAAQAELARGRRPEACARGRSANVGEQAPPFLLRLRAYCAAVTGDRAAADLALELARAQNAADTWYSGAVAAAAGAPSARPPAANYGSSLSTQLSLAGRLRPGPNALNTASTLSLIALARAEQAPQPQRAQAAALAYQRGAISAAEARTILRATPAEITSALLPIVTALRVVDAARSAPTQAPAPIAPGAPAPSDPSLEAAAAISRVLRQAATPADFSAAARFFNDDIAGLHSAPDAGAALLFARAALAADDARLGQRLVEAARQAGVDETALAPLDAALAVLGDARGQAGLVAVQRRIDRGVSQPNAAARDVAILTALGAPTDGAVLNFMLANAPRGGARADQGAMQALNAAVERQALGEGALLAVIAAGEAGPARLDADSVTGIIRALRTLGLEDDARRVAVEVILAGQPS